MISDKFEQSNMRGETQGFCYLCTKTLGSIGCMNVDTVCNEGSRGYFIPEGVPVHAGGRRSAGPYTLVDGEIPEPVCMPTDEERMLELAPSEQQVGGGHYKDYPIQPAEYCQRNKLNHCEASIVKYATRHQSKGKVEDVRKIIHYAQLILEWEYNIK